MSKTRLVLPSMPESVSAGALKQQSVRFATHVFASGADPLVIDGFAPAAERIFLHPSEAPRRALLDAAKADPRLADALVRAVFPRVALMLEDGWNTDRLSFVDVTIAATRLQDAVRALGHFVLPMKSESLVMIVPPWEQHGLPPSLAAAHLRQKGVPTRLIQGLSAQQMWPLISRSGPSGILISVGSYRSASKLRPLIEALRTQIQRPLPIIVGGPALEANAALCRQSGADLVTSDLNAALSFCDFALDSAPTQAGDIDA